MPLDRTRLTMTLNETPSGIIGSCSYQSDLSAGQPWVDDYEAILAAAATNPRKPIGRLADGLKKRSVSDMQVVKIDTQSPLRDVSRHAALLKASKGAFSASINGLIIIAQCLTLAAS